MIDDTLFKGKIMPLYIVRSKWLNEERTVPEIQAYTNPYEAALSTLDASLCDPELQ